MIDYEVYNGSWMRPIRAKNINNCLKAAVKIMEKTGFYYANVKKHDIDGYPTKLGNIRYTSDGWIYQTINGGSIRKIR